MSGTDYALPTEEEKQELLTHAQGLLSALRRFSYFSPYSYQDIAQDKEAVETLRTIAKSLTHIDKTYFGGR